MLIGVARIASGVGLTVGLLALGLGLTGTTARARSFLDLGGPAALTALAGSSTSPSAELTIDGTPTRVRSCLSPEGPRVVFEHYRQVAAREAGDEPWVEARDPDGGGLITWLAPEGLRKSVRVEREPRGGARYELMEADPAAPGARRLPCDLPVPALCQVAFSVVRQDGTGMALLLARSSPDAAARSCLETLAAQGFSLDPAAAAALDGLARDSGEGDLPLCLPFGAPGRRGLLVVSPADGGARVSLAIHPAA